MAFTDPNYTQMPNEIFGDQKDPGVMADMSDAELRITLALCRLTFGFHRDEVKASLTVLENMTGLSRQGAIDGIEAAVKRGLIERNPTPPNTCSEWRVVKPVDQLETSQDSRPEVVKSVDQPAGQTSQASRHMKETKKEKKETHGGKAAQGGNCLLSSTPQRRILKAKFAASISTPKGQKGPQQFPTLATAQKFDKAAARLNGNLERAIDKALDAGLNTIPRLVAYIAKFEPDRTGNQPPPVAPKRPPNLHKYSIPEEVRQAEEARLAPH